MDKDEIINQWTGSIENGTFLTPKHDPNNLSTAYASFRTVLTPQMSSSLENFIHSRNFSINVYLDNRFNNFYYEILSSDPSYSRLANGVPSGSIQTGSLCDRLVVVSGSQQGWHIMGEDSATINQEIQNGRFVLSASLK
ncbi:MAG: hypothetical protein LC124_07265 [Ignavibacteriales bacterium]|jgi:hypothetical protein|nr:hypothetical protein [Ignavibacteriales bacterium]MDX9712489.1 hypothetical protein [Ignavibacteriaceae bacterium]